MSNDADPANVHVVIDMRDSTESWFADVSGLRMVVRTLVCLRHAGYRTATLVGQAGARARALAERHPYHAIELDLVDDVPSRTDRLRLLIATPVVLSSTTAQALASQATEDGYAVPVSLPTGTPGFLLPARTAAERRHAAWVIRKASHKPVEEAGVVSALVLQHIGLQVSRVLCHFPVTPNAVTVFGLMLGFAALPLFWIGSAKFVAIGVSLLFVNAILDEVDGELARMKYRFTPLGERLDHVADMVLGAVLLAPVGMGLYHATDQIVWAVLGWAGSGSWAIYTLTVQYYVTRQRHSGYTTGFRFWYRIPKSGPAKPKPATAPSTASRYLQAKYLFRKDLSFTLFFICGLAGYLQLPFALAAFGGIEYGVLSLIQLTLFHNRVSFKDSDLGKV